MKNRSIIALVLSALMAPLLHAQTPSPSPSPAVGSIYPDSKKPIAARIADAQAVLAGDPDDEDVESATYILETLTIQSLTPATYKTTGGPMVEALIAAKGVSVTPLSYAHSTQIYCLAITAKAHFAIVGPVNQIAFLKSFVDAIPSTDDQTSWRPLVRQYAYFMDAAANSLIRLHRYADALVYCTSPVVLNDLNEYPLAIRYASICKTNLGAADAIPWAKVQYLVAPYADSQTAIFNVMKAIEGLNFNQAAADAFFASQNAPAAPNALTSVPIPDALATWTVPIGTGLAVSSDSLNTVIHGDAVAALTMARADLVNAAPGAEKSAAALKLAQVIRDADLGLTQASAVLDKVNSGQPFTISQLATPTPSPSPTGG